jgi:hypothetical protein
MLVRVIRGHLQLLRGLGEEILSLLYVTAEVFLMISLRDVNLLVCLHNRGLGIRQTRMLLMIDVLDRLLGKQSHAGHENCTYNSAANYVSNLHNRSPNRKSKSLVLVLVASELPNAFRVEIKMPQASSQAAYRYHVFLNPTLTA